MTQQTQARVDEILHDEHTRPSRYSLDLAYGFLSDGRPADPIDVARLIQHGLNVGLLLGAEDALAAALAHEGGPQ